MSQSQSIINVVHALATGEILVPDVRPGVKGYIAFLNVLIADGTDPTLDVDIDDSLDGATWFNLVTFTQKTAALQTERKEWSVWDGTPKYTGSQLKINYIIGGTDPDITFQLRLEPII